MKTRAGRLAALAYALAFVSAGSSLAPGAGVAGAAGACGDPATRPWCDTSLSPDRRAQLVLAAMTPDQRIAFLGGDTTTGGPVNSQHTGASFGFPELGIPPVYYTDGPVGVRQGSSTAMPIPMALAATFDKANASAYGGEIATEARQKGNDVVFAPTVNIMRTPQNGRTYEAFGEDPYLDTRTTVNWIEGAQAQGVLADVKHYAANNQEGLGGLPPLTSVLGGRQYENDVVDERTLREIYLPHFEAAVKEAQVATVMCSYNQVNGAYACESDRLLNQVLRKDWGFQGYVIADYAAAHNTVNNVQNGLDFEPWPAIAYSPQALTAARDAGVITQQQIDGHVLAILRTLFAYGVVDRPKYRNDDAQIDMQSHAALAQRTEESAITLLRNDSHLLPLDAATIHSIAVIGPYADRFITGGGSGQVKPFATTTALAGIRARVGPGVSVTYDDGSDATRAAGVAAAADVAIVVVGDVMTEGQDKSCIDLNCPNDAVNALAFECSSTCPPNGSNQDALVSAVAAANRRTVTVLETGGPVLTPFRDQVGALVEAWYPGQQGGAAIARVLFGDTDPGGRLPVTFPQSANDLPTAGSVGQYPGLGEQVSYSEGVLVGYRWYDAHNITPAFAFGSGLSYTTFRYSDLSVATGGSTPGAVATVTATVTNTGARTGTAVPQLYLGLPSPGPSVVQPPRQLRGYTKLSLAPGESRRVSFALDDRAFSYWDTPSSTWRVAPGCYPVQVGASSRDLATTAEIARGGAACAATAAVAPAAAASQPPPPATSGAAPAVSLPNTSRMSPATVATQVLAVALLGAGLFSRRRARRPR
ncbi:MAG TPA: glycoside hydrolase family 3 C-terminal domain-containing protein [Candidatus Dormibacteraeota bacterium]|nr:glycoside hydrolase family 3 C-terminal domain-containing protein [Candidatus Dormibacteraeota bacterium]